LRTRNSERTKERILNAAERLFSEQGFDGVSVRDIAATAGVQLALISYYFRNKQGLYRAVFRRRIDAVSNERLTRLQEILGRKRPQPTIEEVLDALARPWVEMREKRSGLHYTRLIAREVADPNENSRGIVKEMLDPIALKFIDAMCKVLPNHRRSEIHWAYHLFIGGLLLILLKEERIERLSGRLCDMRDSERVVREIVGLFARALRNSPKTKQAAISSARKPGGRKASETRNVLGGRGRTAQRRLDQ
jgi:AcrR family transcriptional regulator